MKRKSLIILLMVLLTFMFGCGSRNSYSDNTTTYNENNIFENISYTKEVISSKMVVDTEKETTTEEPTTTVVKTVIIGNKNTKAYHTPSCSRLPKEKNRVYFDSEEEANAAGYDNPCDYCKP